MKNCLDILLELHDSPMIQLSNGEKELFHSNLLYWISQVKKFDDNISGKHLFRNILKDAGIANLPVDDNWIVRREANHRDLSVIEPIENNMSRKLLVIENKTKSIPSISQLKQIYKEEKKNKKNNNIKYVLLTIIDNFPGSEKIGSIDSEEGLSHWTLIPYSKLYKAILNNLPEDHAGYKWQILKDYATNFNYLYEICKYLEPELDKPFYIDEKVKNELETLRILDLIQKQRMAKFASMIRQHIADDDIVIAPNFAKSGGALVDICREVKRPSSIKKNEEPLKLWIQIQNNRYEHCITSLDSSYLEANSDECSNICDSFSGFFKEDNKTFQKAMEQENRDVFTHNNCRNLKFLSFCDSGNKLYMLYQYSIIKEDVTFGHLLEQILKDIKQINKYK